MKKILNKPPPAKGSVSAPAQDSFQNFAARIGYGTGNLTDASRYSIDYLSRDRFRLEAMYRSSWICGKAVDSVAEDMTKRGIEINSEVEPGALDQLQEHWKTLKLWDAIADTIKWARLYGGAVAVMLIDGQNMATPLRVETVKRDQFKGLCVLDRWQVQPSLDQLVQTLGPDLGMPTLYTVYGASRALSGAKIHYSRVIRIDGQDLPYWQAQAENLWGQSVIERLFDRLLAFDSTTQGAAQLVLKAHLRTYKVEGLRDIIAAGGQVLQGLTKQMDFLRMTQTNEGLTLMDTKDEFEAHSYTFSGLDTVLLQFSQQLSGALDIPLTRLFGQSPAGLNSTGESDMRNYYDGIAQQQERRLRTGVGVLLALTHLSLFGAPVPEGSGFTFRPLWQMSDIEKGTLAATLTTAITSACTSSIVGRQTALKELRQQSRLTGVWTNISDEDIAAADNNVDTGGEFGARGPNGGVEDDERFPVRDGWNEGDHPRAANGEFDEGGGAAHGGTPKRPRPDRSEHFKYSNEELQGRAAEALAWVRGGEGRFVPGAIPHPEIAGGIGLLHGYRGDTAPKWKRGFGVSHIDTKHPGHLDEAIKMLPNVPVTKTLADPKTGQVMEKELFDGKYRAIVSLNFNEKEAPAWLLSSYERT